MFLKPKKLNSSRITSHVSLSQTKTRHGYDIFLYFPHEFSLNFRINRNIFIKFTLSLYIYMQYMHIHIHMHIYIYIHIYIDVDVAVWSLKRRVLNTKV